MENLLAVLIGVLFSAGIYLILRRSIVKLILGIGFLTQATNLLLLWAGGLQTAKAPIVKAAGSQYADPLPQALVLTAIVISFGLLAFFLVLIARAFAVQKSDDLDQFVEEQQKEDSQ